MRTTLNFRVRGKTKKTVRDTYKKTLDMELEQDRSIGLGPTTGDSQTNRQKLKHIFYKTFLDTGSDL